MNGQISEWLDDAVSRHYQCVIFAAWLLPCLEFSSQGSSPARLSQFCQISLIQPFTPDRQAKGSSEICLVVISFSLQLDCLKRVSDNPMYIYYFWAPAFSLQLDCLKRVSDNPMYIYYFWTPAFSLQLDCLKRVSDNPTLVQLTLPFPFYRWTCLHSLNEGMCTIQSIIYCYFNTPPGKYNLAWSAVITHCSLHYTLHGN